MHSSNFTCFKPIHSCRMLEMFWGYWILGSHFMVFYGTVPRYRGSGPWYRKYWNKSWALHYPLTPYITSWVFLLKAFPKTLKS